MPSAPVATELELSALTAWTRAQQAALSHQHLVVQAAKDEKKAERDAKEEKEKKKDEDEVKPDNVTAETIVTDILHKWCPALYDFLDIFGPPHAVLPVFVALHFLFLFAAPWYLLGLLPVPLTHILPASLALKSLFSPAGALDKAYDEAKRAHQKECDKLKKQGKDKADFPDQPKPPPAWQVYVRDRSGWLAYWLILGVVEYAELLFFGDQIGGLVWWPKLKAIFLISLYFVWSDDEKGHYKTCAVKLMNHWLSVSTSERKEGGKGETKTSQSRR